MTIACVIPARYNSIRFLGKLLAKAGGKTVLQRTFEQAALCPDLDAIYIATDDERIAGHVKEFGGEVIWTSPECKNGTERICEAVGKHPKLKKASLIVNLQGDHPCTEPSTISAIVKQLRFDKKAVMSTAVTEFKNRSDLFLPQMVKCVFDQNGNALYFSRAPIPGYAHIGIYCYRRAFLLEMLGAGMTPLQKMEDLEQLKVLELGYRIKVAIVDEVPLGVDTPEDLVKLEQILCRSNISL